MNPLDILKSLVFLKFSGIANPYVLVEPFLSMVTSRFFPNFLNAPALVRRLNFLARVLAQECLRIYPMIDPNL